MSYIIEENQRVSYVINCRRHKFAMSLPVIGMTALSLSFCRSLHLFFLSPLIIERLLTPERIVEVTTSRNKREIIYLKKGANVCTLTTNSSARKRKSRTRFIHLYYNVKSKL